MIFFSGEDREVSGHTTIFPRLIQTQLIPSLFTLVKHLQNSTQAITAIMKTAGPGNSALEKQTFR